MRGVCVCCVVAEDDRSMYGIGACGDVAWRRCWAVYVCVCGDGCVVDGREVCEWSLGCWVLSTCAVYGMGPVGASEVAGAVVVWV